MGVTGLVGMVLAVVAVMCQHHDRDGRRARHAPNAVGLSVLAGSCFATSLIALSLTPPESGFVPLMVARVVGAA